MVPPLVSKRLDRLFAEPWGVKTQRGDIGRCTWATEQQLLAGNGGRQADRDVRGLASANGDALGLGDGLAIAGDLGDEGVVIVHTSLELGGDELAAIGRGLRGVAIDGQRGVGREADNDVGRGIDGALLLFLLLFLFLFLLLHDHSAAAVAGAGARAAAIAALLLEAAEEAALRAAAAVIVAARARAVARRAAAVAGTVARAVAARAAAGVVAAATVLQFAEQTTAAGLRAAAVAAIARTASVTTLAKRRDVGAATQSHQDNNTVHCVAPPKEYI